MAKISRQQPTEDAENGHTKHTEGNGNITEKKQNTSDAQFVKRVVSLPLIQDSVSTAQAIANKTSLGRFALSKANSTYNTVTYFATNSEPFQAYYQNYFQPHVQKVDEFGCRSLDAIQSKVPIITQPSSDIYQTMTKPTYQMIDNAKLRLDSTISTVTHPAHVVIEETNKRLGIYVDNLETVVDKYLPMNDKREMNNSDNINNDNNNNSNNNNNQVIRVYDVLNEASRRITEKVTNQVNKSTSGIPKSRQDLTRLIESNPTLQNITSQISLLQETVVHSITVYGNIAQEHLPASVTLRVQQTSELFAHVSVTMNQQLSHLTDFLKTQPDWVKDKLHSVIETTKQQLEMITQELARKDITVIDKFKHVANNLQEQILPLLQQISSQLATSSDAVREKVKHELNVPIQYFGLAPKMKTQ